MALTEMEHKIRQLALDGFIERAGWGDADRMYLQADASFRRYIRLKRGNESVMLMDAPPPQENIEPFLVVAKHLCQLGFSAPRILQEDAFLGFLLLEDFGDATFTQLLNQGMGEGVLYEAAIDTLIKLHQHPDNARVAIGEYDLEVLLTEAELFLDWYVPELDHTQTPETLRQGFRDAWLDVLSHQPKLNACIVLRDFHVDNLMLLPNRMNPENCGLLDFQDALIGSSSYDVASLLEDARRDISQEFRQNMLTRYLTGFTNLDREAFMTSYVMLSAQRHMKIVGIFTRLYRRDGKAHYLAHIPRVLAYLQQHLSHPVLAPVATWLKTHTPEFTNLPDTLQISELTAPLES